MGGLRINRFCYDESIAILPLDGGRIMTEFFQHKLKAGNRVETGIKVASTAFFLAIIILVFFADFSRIT